MKYYLVSVIVSEGKLSKNVQELDIKRETDKLLQLNKSAGFRTVVRKSELGFIKQYDGNRVNYILCSAFCSEQGLDDCKNRCYKHAQEEAEYNYNAAYMNRVVMIDNNKNWTEGK